MKKNYGTALNCIDGRTQIPVINWMQQNCCVNYVDLITELGMDKVLSQGSCDEIERLRRNTIISINAHHAKVVAVVGHDDCAANPVSDQEHYYDIRASMRVVKSWELPVTVIGLFVDKFRCVLVVK
ncbi:MAG: carbonic anhydrase [Lachnotalea sp.]